MIWTEAAIMFLALIIFVGLTCLMLVWAMEMDIRYGNDKENIDYGQSC